MIHVGPSVLATLAAAAGASGEGRTLVRAVETVEAWLAALTAGDERRLVASSALPFIHRSNGLREKCDVVARDHKAFRHWARCLRASKELKIAELAGWRHVRIYRGLPPAGLTALKYGLNEGDPGDGRWVQGFVEGGPVTFAVAFLVVEAPRDGTAIRAFVIDARAP